MKELMEHYPSYFKSVYTEFRFRDRNFTPTLVIDEVMTSVLLKLASPYRARLNPRLRPEELAVRAKGYRIHENSFLPISRFGVGGVSLDSVLASVLPVAASNIDLPSWKGVVFSSYPIRRSVVYKAYPHQRLLKSRR